jgi:hypothetical protein
VMIQERNKAGDRSFEVDVVFPQGVIGVDEQGLRVGWGIARHGEYHNQQETFFVRFVTIKANDLVC